MKDDYIRKEDAVEALDGKVIVTGHENADAVLQYMKDISNKIKSLEPADVVQVETLKAEIYKLKCQMECRTPHIEYYSGYMSALSAVEGILAETGEE